MLQCSFPPPCASECYQSICIISQYSPVWWKKNQLGRRGTEEPTCFRGHSGFFEPEDVHLWVTCTKTSKGNQLYWGAAVGDQTHTCIRSLVQGSDWILTQLGCTLMTTGGDWRSQKDPIQTHGGRTCSPQSHMRLNLPAAEPRTFLQGCQCQKLFFQQGLAENASS